MNMKNEIHYLLLIKIFLLSSCQLIKPNRAFIDQMEAEEGVLIPMRDFVYVVGDQDPYMSKKERRARTPQDIYGDQPLHQNQLLDQIMENRIFQKEELMTSSEMEDWNLFESLEPSLSQKNFFLSLTPIERKIYLQQHKTHDYTPSSVALDNQFLSVEGQNTDFIQKGQSGVSRNLASFESASSQSMEYYQDIPNSTIAVGMDFSEVLNRLGAPARQDVAGEKQYGHQRWIYKDQSIEQVYFERGQVVGWERSR